MKLNSYLGCFKLETGGLIIGWLGFIGNILFALLFLFPVVIFSRLSCDEIERVVVKLGIDHLLQDCLVARAGRIVAMVSNSVIIIFLKFPSYNFAFCFRNFTGDLVGCVIIFIDQRSQNCKYYSTLTSSD